MSEDCIFCSIVDGEIPSYTVYEDDHVVAFLDANPLAAGHTVVIPKDHHERLDDLPEAVSTALFDAIEELVPAVQAAADAPATNVGINNGEAAGQEIPHVHWHVVPRSPGDAGTSFHAVTGSIQDVPEEEMETLAEDISDGV